MGTSLNDTLTVSDFSKYILLNESFSWTPDLMETLKNDKGTIDRILNGNEDELKRFFNGHRNKMENYLVFKKNVIDDEIASVAEKMVKGGISLITLFDDDYPARLKGISDPPLVLFHIGTLFDMSKCVAISGTRHPSPGIENRTFELAEQLVEKGFTVISGLAKGVDTSAHEGALFSSEGTTVAVMANGLDRVIPRCNIDLAKRISSRGAVLSEKTLRPEPSRYDFIRRNRIISGISGVQIIMQSSGSGGTEHQFDIARHQGRPVLVYTGSDLSEPSKKSASLMTSKGAKGFKSIDEGVELVRTYWVKEGSAACRKDVPLDLWN